MVQLNAGSEWPPGVRPITKDEWVDYMDGLKAGALEPCDHWSIERCFCKGACGCHWVTDDVCGCDDDDEGDHGWNFTFCNDNDCDVGGFACPVKIEDKLGTLVGVGKPELYEGMVIDMWDNEFAEQSVKSVIGGEYGPDDWVFCIQCDEVFQVKDLTDGDKGGDYCPKCGAGGLDQDVFSVDSDLASEEIRGEYEQRMAERDSLAGSPGGDVEADEDWLFDGHED